MQRDGQAQERAQAKLKRNRRRFERKISTFLVRAANAPVGAENAPYGELHTSTNSRSSDHERGEHTAKRLWSGRGLRFWHALEGKIKEEKTFRQGS